MPVPLASPLAALLAALALFFLGAPALCAEPASARPNLVLIYTDDQRHDSLSAAGNTWFETPALDRLAREGVLFERAYVTMALCCPGRTSVLTGKYPHVTGVTDNQPVQNFLDRHRTFADLLQEAGYETAFIGKWHLPNPGAQPVRGFDHWVSFEEQGEYFDERMNVDGQQVQTRGYNSDVLVDYARAFIAKERGERPFLLFLSLKECHSPHLPPRRFRGALDEVEFELPDSFGDDPAGLPAPYRVMRFNRRNRGAHPHPELYLLEVQRYWELVLVVDHVVARVLAALEERGALDSTAVAFTSDNGYLLGEHGLIQKGVTYEPSIRVPLVMRYPPRLPAGRRSAALALNVDLMPTLVELAGLPVPADVMGRSLLGVARGEVEGWREDFLYTAPWFTKSAAPVELALAGGRWKYVRFRPGEIDEALFDLEADPEERVDLAELAAHAQELERARGRMRELLAELGMPASWWDPDPKDR